MSFRFRAHAPRSFILDSSIAPPLEMDPPPLDDREPGREATWGDFQDSACVVLLGEPNIGKSRELLHQHDELKKAGQTSFHTELKLWSAGDDLIEQQDGLADAFESGKTFYWFIDSLDEGRLQSDEMFPRLLRSLEKLKLQDRIGGLKLRLSCRAAEWKTNEFQRLHKLFGEERGRLARMTVARVQPLDEEAIRQLAAEKLDAGDVEHFFDACRRNAVFHLAGFPLLLASMLGEFKSSGVLAANRTELFEQAIESLLKEVNETRVDHATIRTRVSDRRRIAEILASRSVLTGRIRFSLDEADELLGSIPVEKVGTRRADLQETLGSGLFVKHADRSYTFVHRSFADFCAAREFSHALRAGRPLRGILPAFAAELGGLPFPVRETASFLAGMNSSFRAWLIENDTIAACNGDTRSYTAADRLQLIRKLAEQFKGLNYQVEFSRVGDLAHDIPEQELRPLLQRSSSPAVRSLAIEMIAGSSSSALRKLLLERALDDAEEIDLRVRAIDVLCRIDPSDCGQKLKAGINPGPHLDPRDEMMGAVLQGLYPDSLSVDEALACFHLPRGGIRRNRYKDFWSSRFWAGVESVDQRRRALNVLAQAFDLRGEAVGGVPSEEEQRASSGIAWGSREVFETFCAQLKTEVSAPDFDVDMIAPWLHVASMAGPRYGALPATSLGVSLSSPLRAALLRWVASSLPKDRDLRPRLDIPFFEQAWGIDDLDLLIDAVDLHLSNPRISIPLYRTALCMVMEQSGEVNRMTKLEALAEQSPSLMAELASLKATLEMDALESRNHQDALIAESDAHSESPHRPLDDARLAEFAGGDVDDFLANLDGTLESNISQEFMEVLKTLPEPVEVAVRKGAVLAWYRFSGAAHLWGGSRTQNTWSPPPGALAACVGFWVHIQERGVDDAFSPTDEQAELLVWLALHSGKEFARLLAVVWDVAPEVTARRLEWLLESEDVSDRPVKESLWPRLRDRATLPPGLVEFAKAFALGHMEARDRGVRAAVLSFLWRHADITEMRSILGPIEAKATALLATQGAEDAIEDLALLSLAMVWLAEGQSVDRFGPVAFGRAGHLRRAVAFVDAIAAIARPDQFTGVWGPDLSTEMLGVLVPYLFAKDEREQPSSVDDYQIASRNQVFQHLLKFGDLDWLLLRFGKWKDDERFGNLRSYLAEEHARLLRKSYDQAWKPMSGEEAAALMETGSLVRTPRDVMYFLEDLIETKLVPSFQKDYSLTPLLWGKKTDAEPRDEKEVQTAVYALLRVYVQEAKVFGAREPEQYDAKKPDIRLDFEGREGGISVPVEIKWSHNPSVWSALADQLVELYMRDPDITYGVYLVAWSGKKVKSGPNGVVPGSVTTMLEALREEAARVSQVSGKTISVYVLDASRPSGASAGMASHDATRTT